MASNVSVVSSQDKLAEFDSYNNENDPFIGIDFDAVAELGPQIKASSQPSGASEPCMLGDDGLSTDSGNGDSPKTLGSRADSQPPPAAAPAPRLSSISASDLLTNTSQTTARPSLKRKSSDDALCPPASKATKYNARDQASSSKAETHYTSVREVLRRQEDGFKCPICKLIFTEPQVISPCGHCVCGECIVNWIKEKTSDYPECPTCRTFLSEGVLVLPNLSMRDAVEAYIGELTLSGVEDWQEPQGKALLDWRARKSRWPHLEEDLIQLQAKRWDDEASQNADAASPAYSPMSSPSHIFDFPEEEKEPESPRPSPKIYWITDPITGEEYPPSNQLWRP